jgi:hypothetical protein
MRYVLIPIAHKELYRFPKFNEVHVYRFYGQNVNINTTETFHWSNCHHVATVKIERIKHRFENPTAFFFVARCTYISDFNMAEVKSFR